jgi:hypothetical protein
MNHAKIAAALHALADAFLEGAEVTAEAPAKKGRAKASPAASTEPAPAADAAPAQPEPATEPAAPAPTVTKDQLNKAVLKVAAKNRDAAVTILAKYGNGAANTVTLAPEYWQPVYDALEEEIARIDAAAVQVAQASLV